MLANMPKKLTCYAKVLQNAIIGYFFPSSLYASFCAKAMFLFTLSSVHRVSSVSTTLLLRKTMVLWCKRIKVCSECFTIHPLGRPHYSDTNSTSLWSIRSCCNYCAYFSLTFPPLSRTKYSFVQLSQLGHRGDNENVQASKWQQRGFEPGLSRFFLRVPSRTTHMSRALFSSHARVSLSRTMRPLIPSGGR